VATILDQLGLNKSDTQHNADTSSGLTLPPAVLPGLDNHDFPYPQKGAANATFVFLARNSDLEGVVSSVRQMEDRFNRKYNYPWVFLNDEPFSEEFIR
jgi:alpha 1,2-mannosyltransferase